MASYLFAWKNERPKSSLGAFRLSISVAERGFIFLTLLHVGLRVRGARKRQLLRAEAAVID
jgi:hypothetical protein